MPVVKQQQSFVNQPIGVTRVNTGVPELWQTVSNAAANIMEMAVKEGAEEAEQFGLDAALSQSGANLRTIDPLSGKPVAFASPKGLGDIGQDAYERVINQRFEDSMNQEMKLRAAEIAQSNPNPAAYDAEMSRYIADMSDGAIGRYKNYIEETGGFYLASTKLNLQARAAASARASASASVLAGMNLADNALYDMSRTGVDTTEAFGAAMARVQDGLDAGLISQSDAVKAYDTLTTTAATGHSEYLLSQSMSAETRANIQLAIRTDGLAMAAIPETLREDVGYILGYTNRENSKDIMTSVDAFVSDYNAVDKFNIERAQRDYNITLSNTISSYGTTASRVLMDATQAGPLTNFAAAWGAIDSSFANAEAEIQAQYVGGAFSSDAEFSGAVQDLRRSMLDRMLIDAAIDGNVEQLSTAIATQDHTVIGLTEKQRQLVGFLSSGNTSAYDMDQDLDHVQSFLSGTKNDFQEKRDKEISQIQFDDFYNQTIDEVRNGNFNNTEAMIDQAKEGLGDWFTSDGFQRMEDALRVANAVGTINNLSSVLSGMDMSNLSKFLLSDGKNTEGLSQPLIDHGQAILDGVDYAQDIPELKTHISAIRERMARQEAAAVTAATRAQNINNVKTGAAGSSSRTDRELADEIFNTEHGEGYLETPESVNAETYNMMRNTLPQSVLDKLVSAYNGQSLDQVTFSHYLALANDIDPDTGVPINRWAQDGGLSDGQIARLESVHIISRAIGSQDLNVIAQRIEANMNDTAIQADVVKRFEDDDGIAEWVRGIVDEDTYVASRLEPLARYMASNGIAKDEIALQLERQMDTFFAPTDLVFDLRFPDGGRSEYALAAVIPDKGAQQFFAQTIQAELPSGYRLRATTLISNIAPSRTGDTEVVLVPYKASPTDTPIYNAYSFNDFGELEPVMADGMLAAWGLEELAPYYANMALDDARRQEEIDAKYEQDVLDSASRRDRLLTGGAERSDEFDDYNDQKNQEMLDRWQQ